MKCHLEQKLVLHRAKRSEVKNLAYVDFYEIHQDHVEGVVDDPRIKFFDPNPEDYITGVLICKYLQRHLLRYNFLGKQRCQGIRLGLRKDRHKKHIISA